ncbi:hypothetical protein C0Q70_14166 [Pomacea canaliculata]|uniref:Uncharacterized protein n=1 Tax=Pomacea canaliculata TaxID=400727 RepID=A0A2T7NZ92_POMCA|nr:hypothetical protein C0Q70_14166 [Pomacea canaliculata]
MIDVLRTCSDLCNRKRLEFCTNIKAFDQIAASNSDVSVHLKGMTMHTWPVRGRELGQQPSLSRKSNTELV